MKCPLCAYEVSWETNDEPHGKFFTHPVDAKRNESIYNSESREEVYGCPQCGVLFMNHDRRTTA